MLQTEKTAQVVDTKKPFVYTMAVVASGGGFELGSNPVKNKQTPRGKIKPRGVCGCLYSTKEVGEGRTPRLGGF